MEQNNKDKESGFHRTIKVTIIEAGLFNIIII